MKRNSRARCARRGSCRNIIRAILDLLLAPRLLLRRASRFASHKWAKIAHPSPLRDHLMQKNVHIIGAGISGLSAAVRLANA